MTDFGEGQSLEGELRKTVTPIKDVLKNARNEANRAVPNDLRCVNVSPLLSHMRELRDATTADSRHREHAKAVYINPNDRLLVSKSPTILTEQGGMLEKPDNLIDQFVLDMHTHGDQDSPPSPIDLQPLFYSSSVRGVPTGRMVITDSQTALFMRGQRTPIWDHPEAVRHVAEWDQEADRRMAEAILLNNPRELLLRWRSGGVVNPAELQQVGFAAQHAYAGLVREIAREYDLRWFSGAPDSQVLTLQTA